MFENIIDRTLQLPEVALVGGIIGGIIGLILAKLFKRYQRMRKSNGQRKDF